MKGLSLYVELFELVFDMAAGVVGWLSFGYGIWKTSPFALAVGGVLIVSTELASLRRRIVK